MAKQTVAFDSSAATLKTSAVHISFQFLINLHVAVLRIINGLAFAGQQMTMPRFALYVSIQL
jgi:hypothetical protein